jgi:hypothetical protein
MWRTGERRSKAGEPTSPDAGCFGVIVRRAAARRHRDGVPLRVGPALRSPRDQWRRRSGRVICRSTSVTTRRTSLGQSRVCAQAGEDAMADDGPPAAKLPKPGYYHIPSPVVVACMPTHRKPTDVGLWRGSSQSCVGTVPSVTSTPHWPACWARRSTSIRPWTWPSGCCQWRRRCHRWTHDGCGAGPCASVVRQIAPQRLAGARPPERSAYAPFRKTPAYRWACPQGSHCDNAQLFDILFWSGPLL